MSLWTLPLGALVSPGLLGLGAGLMALPIIIHLLNKRKFKIIDWAAMDFLLEADRLNRRRIRLEDLLLLLMRCLAVLLAGFLVARPFFSSNPLSSFVGGARYERYVMLDDSLSMDAQVDGMTAFGRAKNNLERWLVELSAGNNDESLTLFIASRPDRPLYNGVPLNADSVSEIANTVKQLQPSDRKVDLLSALKGLEDNLRSQEDSVNRIVYFLTDARVRDWAGGGGGDPLPAGLTRVSKLSGDCFLVNFSSMDHGNLLVESVVAADKVLIAGVPARFEVTVRNTGEADAESVRVEFGAKDVLPMKTTIDRIAAGRTASVPFTYTFAAPEKEGTKVVSVPLLARVKPAGDSQGDRLTADNEHFFAARVLTGIPTLLVDGDPSTEFGRTETFFTAKAMAPRGALRSGIAVRSVGESEFENIPLDAYQVVYLCNMYRVSEERLRTLENWVAGGGGLVFTLGDQVDGETYRRLFHKEGKGLFPLELTGMLGDESEQQWVGLQARQERHPVMQIFEGEGNPLLEAIKVFRWWGSTIPGTVKDALNVLSVYTDPDQSPAIVEMPFGKGRVVVFTSPLDIDWNTWPREAASYLITLQELTRYLAPSTAGRYAVSAGEPIVQAVDLARYRSDLSLALPSGENTGLQARSGGAPADTVWQATHEDTGRRGFYRLSLTRNEDGGTDDVLYAADIDPDEGELEPMERAGLQSLLEGSGVEIIDEVTIAGVSADASRHEWWPFVLMGLVALLIGEQTFACHLGGKR